MLAWAERSEPPYFFGSGGTGTNELGGLDEARSFAVDVLKCQDCGARMRIIQKVENPTVDELNLASFVISGQAAAAMKADNEARAPPRFRWPSRTQELQDPKNTAVQ